MKALFIRILSFSLLLAFYPIQKIVAQQYDVKEHVNGRRVEFSPRGLQIAIRNNPNRNRLIKKFGLKLPSPNGESVDMEIKENRISETVIDGIYTFEGRTPSGDIITRLTYYDGAVSGIMKQADEYYFLEPDAQEGFYTLDQLDHDDLKHISCHAEHEDDAKSTLGKLMKSTSEFTYGDKIREFRMAAASTGELFNHYGSKSAALAAIVEVINAANLIYEQELAMRFRLITKTTNETLIFDNSTTDPFYVNPSFGQANDAQNGFRAMNTSGVLQYSEYDVGHVFNVFSASYIGARGTAGPIPCLDSWKARGWTEWSSSTTQLSIAVGVFVHEVGHQFNAWHTYNAVGGFTPTSTFCTSGWSSTDAVEPGGGSTLMGYGTNCRAPVNYVLEGDNALSYFNVKSLEKINTYLATTANCFTDIPVANTPPTAQAGGDITIPKGTPFSLTGEGADLDGDILSYTWEQADAATANDKGALGSNIAGEGGYTAVNSTTAPLFRSRQSSSPSRTFPRLEHILNNQNNPQDNFGEDLPQVARTMKFRLTTRDHSALAGGVDVDEIIVNVDPSGPLAVTFPNGGESWTVGDSENLTWAVNGTNSLAPTVDLLLSIDGGYSFPYVLATNISNDGLESVVIPNCPSTSSARVKVVYNVNDKASFFDISDSNFTISSSCSAYPTTICPTTDVQAFAGSADLNLNMVGALHLSSPITSYSGTITSTVTQVYLYDDNTRTTCDSYWLNGDTQINFQVSEDGTYTIANNLSNFVAMTIHEGATPSCTNFLSSNAFYTGAGVSAFSSVSVYLEACKTYTLTLAGSSGGSIDLSISGSGNVQEILTAPTGFSQSYVAINTNSDVVEEVSTTADFQSLPVGDYSVRNIVYPSASNPASFVGNELNTLLTSQCAQLSTNARQLSVLCPGFPTAPSVTNTALTRCGTGTVSFSATCTEGVIKWYVDELADTLLYEGNTFQTPVISQQSSYYVLCDDSGCQSPSVQVTAYIDEVIQNTSSNIAICESETKTISATPSGGTWSIESGGGSISGNTYTPADITENTSVVLRYTVAASVCTPNYSEVAFDVIPNIENNTSTATICENSTKTLAATPSGGTWSIVSGGGSISSNTYTPADIVENTTVTLQYTAPNTICMPNVSQVTFDINPIIENNANTSPICESSSKPLSATPAGGTWSVIGGGGTISGSTYSPDNITADTDVTLRYSVSSSVCATTYEDVAFTINPIVENNTSTVSICENESKVLSAVPSGGAWTIVSGGGSISGNSYTPDNNTENTSVSLRYAVSGTACSSALEDVSFEVVPLIENGTSAATICENQSKTLSATPSGGTWTIVNGGGSISGNSYMPDDITEVTTVTLQYAVSPASCAPNDVSQVSFDVTPHIENLTSTTTICESDTKTLSATPSGGTWMIMSGGGSISGTTYTPADVTSDRVVMLRYSVPSSVCATTFEDVSFTVNPSVENNTSTASICETETKTLSAIPNGGTWTIENGGGTISGDTYTPSDVIEPMAVTLRYSVAPTSCSSTHQDISFTVDPTIENNTSSANICESETKTLSATPAGGIWSVVSGGGSITGNSYAPTDITNDTIVTLQYTVPTSACATSASQLSFGVNPSTQNNTSAAPICVSDTKILSADPAGGTWSIVTGGGAINGSDYTPDGITTNTSVTLRYTTPASAAGACIVNYDEVTFMVQEPYVCNNNITYVDFLGQWGNYPSGERPALIIREEGGLLYVHSFGSCSPRQCDWGEATTPISDALDGVITLQWDAGFKTTYDTISLSNIDEIKRVSESVFHDGSGRYFHDNYAHVKSPCLEYLDIEQITGDPMTYAVEDYIYSNGVIDNNRKINFKSQNTILLDAGFTVEAGSEFDAYIEDCENTSAFEDSLVLVDFYNAMNGINWTETWDLTQPMDTWHGVVLNGDRRVEQLWCCTDCTYPATGNNLQGQIPASFGRLSALRYLHIEGNAIVSTLPASMDNLSQLEYLYGAMNQFYGEIPSGFGALLNLKFLALDDNNLSGEIPDFMSPVLEALYLHNNNFTGHMPSFESSNLVNLYLFSNNLTGSLPSYNLPNLEELWISYNNLIGPLPTNINIPSVKRLWASENQLNGSIPTTWDHMTALEEFSLDGNQLSGEFPHFISNFTNLRQVYLNNNNFEGCFQSMPNICGIPATELGYDFTGNLKMPWSGDYSNVCSSSPQTGAPCDDGNPSTSNDMIQADCSCQGN